MPELQEPVLGPAQAGEEEDIDKGRQEMRIKVELGTIERIQILSWINVNRNIDLNNPSSVEALRKEIKKAIGLLESVDVWGGLT